MLALLHKDLLRRWRSPLATVVMLLFPFFMSLMIGSISGGSGSASLPTVNVLLVDEDDDLLGELFSNLGGNEDFEELQLEVVDAATGKARMEAGEASALIRLPAGTTDAVLAGEDVTLELVRNPAEGIKPELVEQGLGVIATVLDLAVKVFGEELRTIRAMGEEDEMPEMAQVTALAGKIFERVLQMERFAMPPAVKIVQVKEQDDGPGFNVFGYILVMVSAMSVLFVSSRVILDFFEDEKMGMLRRTLTTPVRVSTLVDAKLIFGVAFSVLAMVILLLCGFALRWIDSSVAIAPLMLHTVAFSLAACGIMTLVYSVCRTEKQAGILSWIVIMAMSVLGGSMFPAENMPAAMQQVAKFTVNWWAIEGYLDLLVRDIPPSQMLFRTGVLAALGVVLLTVGKLFLMRRFREVQS